MKKLFCVVMAMALLLTCVGCGSGQATEQPSAEAVETSEPAIAPTPSSSPIPEPELAAPDSDVNHFSYEIVENHVEVTGYTGEADEIEIPSMIEGKPVTVVKTDIEMNDSDTAFNNLGFHSNISSILLPDSLTEIGAFTFHNCENLKSINVPDGVKKIETSAFSGCDALVNISLPNSLTEIGGGAFLGCDNLETVVIPEGVTTIGDRAFSSCYSLTSITIPASVKEIGSSLCFFLFPSSLTDVFYNGTAEQWKSITLGEDNSALIDVLKVREGGVYIPYPGLSLDDCLDEITAYLEEKNSGFEGHQLYVGSDDTRVYAIFVFPYFSSVVHAARDGDQECADAWDGFKKDFLADQVHCQGILDNNGFEQYLIALIIRDDENADETLLMVYDGHVLMDASID